MIVDDIPTYEELKQIKEEYTYSLYCPIIGGYFRIKINEDGEKNIALDYLEGGFLAYIHRNFNSKYSFSHLYKFNKKNYAGLIKLYKEMLSKMLKETEFALGKVIDYENRS